MEARSARSRKWVGRALRAGRAAAFLVLATGINGTISELYPRYEPIYVYLLSVVVVAWLGSVLLGVTTAVAAVICYDLMFSPAQSGGLSMSTVVPFAIAIGAALATSMVRVPLKGRQEIAPSAPPPLLPILDAEVLQKPPAIEIERLNALERQAAEARAAFEKEARLRSETMAAARVRQGTLESELTAARAEADRRTREAQEARRELEAERHRVAESDERNAALQRELNTVRPAVTQQSKQSEAMRVQLDSLQRRVTENDERVRTLQHELDEARAALAENEVKAVSIQQELDLAWSRTDEEKARADRESALRLRLERTAGTEAQQAVAAATAKYESTIRTLRQEVETLRGTAEEQQKRADREAKLRGQLEAAARETLQRTAGVSASHQRTATEAQETARRSAERIAELEEQLSASVVSLDEQRQTFESEIASLRAELDDQRSELANERMKREAASAEAAQRLDEESEKLKEAAQRLEEEQSARAAEQNEWNTKLERIVANITTDYEESLGEAMIGRESARAELRTLTSRVDQLKQELAQAREETKKRDDEWGVKLERIVAGVTTDYEESLGEALITREGARAEVRSLLAKVDQLKSELEEAKKSVKQEADQDVIAKIESEWNKKLERIVAGLTTDYEESLGDALVTREAARAEVRDLSAKIDRLRQERDAANKRLDEEKASRDKLELEWSEKLQKIVTHLATDHEADLGEAMIEKEAAKAEVRSLTGRAAALQQRLEQEREMFRQWKEKWKSERLELGGMPKATLTDGQVPLPNVGSGAVVLLVHSDLSIRMTAKNALEQSGYIVVTASDGLEALRTAGSVKPHVVLAEAVMPKMNGRELVQLLKAKRETADVKIVLMSGAFSTDYGTDFKADDFIRNPRDLNVMRETLANVLKKATDSPA